MSQQRRDVMFALNLAPSQKHINCELCHQIKRRFPGYYDDPYKEGISHTEFHFANRCTFKKIRYFGKSRGRV